MAQHIAIIGDGAMATASAMLISQACIARVRMWSAFEEHVREMASSGENRRFLPGVPLPKGMAVSADAAEVAAGADFIIVAVPSPYLRDVLARIAPALEGDAPVVSVVKGIENETLMRPSEIIGELLGPRPVCVLSGPCLAAEIARGLPATAVAAAEDENVARSVQEIYTTERFRVYTNTDVVGVELGGALKNVIAIAAGICDGLEMGDNTKAALLTRGLAEITRLGVAMGARAETFMGLSGMGDLVTTCASALSRNHRVGSAIGKGRKLSEILGEME
ncbi:MAG: NAD(P)H-dependent glycerol-3-phosphate dehydrogenase, partial [Phycisphaerae bacterium]|nr:NAD(P)H-dependent glycerol-3-phosphate dehydrogenase [Phycisphaerae bacterium]